MENQIRMGRSFYYDDKTSIDAQISQLFWDEHFVLFS
jgi:hypothetical protein